MIGRLWQPLTIPNQVSKNEVEASSPTFDERIAALRARAEKSEGNFRQAFLLLSAAEQLHRQAGQYESQRDAIKASPTGGNRKGIRLSHIQHSITRTLKSRDRYIEEAATALAVS